MIGLRHQQVKQSVYRTGLRAEFGAIGSDEQPALNAGDTYFLSGSEGQNYIVELNEPTAIDFTLQTNALQKGFEYNLVLDLTQGVLPNSFSWSSDIEWLDEEPLWEQKVYVLKFISSENAVYAMSIGHVNITDPNITYGTCLIEGCSITRAFRYNC